MISEEKFGVRRALGSILVFLIGLGLFYFLLIIFLSNQIFVSALGALVSITAFFAFLMYESIKTEVKKFDRKKELLIYKRNLLFKLDGTISTVYQTLFNYLTYGVSTRTPPNFQMNYITLQDFRKAQFENYKIYYDDIKYFSATYVVPMQIKEKLEFLNLDAEKLISFLPINTGLISRVIFSRYLTNFLEIIKWTMDDDSPEINDFADNLLTWVGMIVELPSLQQFRGFI